MSSPGLTQAMTWTELDARLKTLLPEEYQQCYEDVEPVSMGSAGLKYGSDGKVAWNEIWGSFCDLAMAGGPPHKGTLLAPGTAEAIAARPQEQERVVAEICRGIGMVAFLPVQRSAIEGWVDVECHIPVKAEWLARAIAMENVSTHCEGTILKLPAGPDYRIAKEIKNVVTSIAKTCHYWDEHMSVRQQSGIHQLFHRMKTEGPFVQPALPGKVSGEQCQRAADETAKVIAESVGLRRSSHAYFGWLGLECPTVNAAVWMMRALVAFNLLVRREDTTLFVPVDPSHAANLSAVSGAVGSVHRLAAERKILSA